MLTVIDVKGLKVIDVSVSKFSSASWYVSKSRGPGHDMLCRLTNIRNRCVRREDCL